MQGRRGGRARIEPRRPALINKIIYFTGCWHNPYISFGDTYMFYPIVVLDFIEAFSLKEISRKKDTSTRVCGFGEEGGALWRGQPPLLSLLGCGSHVHHICMFKKRPRRLVGA